MPLHAGARHAQHHPHRGVVLPATLLALELGALAVLLTFVR